MISTYMETSPHYMHDTLMLSHKAQQLTHVEKKAIGRGSQARNRAVVIRLLRADGIDL